MLNHLLYAEGLHSNCRHQVKYLQTKNCCNS